MGHKCRLFCAVYGKGGGAYLERVVTLPFVPWPGLALLLDPDRGDTFAAQLLEYSIKEGEFHLYQSDEPEFLAGIDQVAREHEEAGWSVTDIVLERS